MKILLIEDEQELSKSIQQYLNGNGVLCEAVNNIQEAFDKITIYQYDCILLDLSLPDGDGFEILKALKVQNKFRRLSLLFVLILGLITFISLIFDTHIFF
jgi:DNA-binding response OmpR family regulator